MRAREASIVKDPRNPSRPWVVRWSECIEDGRRVRRGESFIRQRDAERFASRKTRELRGEAQPAEPSPEPGGLGDTPLGVFIDEYLERRKADGVRRATLDMYRDNLRRLRGHFGDGRAIASLTTDEIAKFVAGQRIKLGKREGQPLAKSSRNGIVRDLGTMFSHAVAWGYVSSSPMAGIRMLKVGDDDHRGWHYFSPADVQAVLREATTLPRQGGDCDAVRHGGAGERWDFFTFSEFSV